MNYKGSKTVQIKEYEDNGSRKFKGVGITDEKAEKIMALLEE